MLFPKIVTRFVYSAINRAFINDSKGIVGHEFQKFGFVEIIPHYDSLHLSLLSFETCQLKSSLFLF